MTDHAERLQPGGFRARDGFMTCPDQRCTWRVPIAGISLGTLMVVARDHLRDPIKEDNDD
jgi:hypothetical protein